MTGTTHPAAGRAAVRAGVVGNYVDQINIFLPVLALAPALSTIAGPHAGATTGAFVVVATLLGRPIGAMLFGRLADRLGRTRTTKVAIAGTAACSLLIAPVHDTSPCPRGYGGLARHRMGVGLDTAQFWSRSGVGEFRHHPGSAAGTG